MIHNNGSLTGTRLIQRSTRKAIQKGCNFNIDAKLEVLKSHKENVFAEL